MPRSPESYAEYREQQAAISRERSAAGREIGPLPEVAHPRRKARCKKSLLDFCRTYFPRRFTLDFADSHLNAIDRMERVTDAGGLFALAMPRGQGKTVLAECAAIRAVLYGFRRFVLLLQATERQAADSLRKIKLELETNELLMEDFPEVCHPIRSLEGISHRANGQTLDGERTRIGWTADGVRLPAVEGSKGSGAVLRVAGITGAVRGLSEAGPGGEILRPDMVLVDDCQTRESASSPTQTAEREAVISDDVMGLAGPTTTIAACMLCTVIYPGDLSDRFLSADRHPEWRGMRTRMLEAWPARMDLWDEYAEVRRESVRSGDGGRRATEFYAARRAEMDEGSRVSWPERMKAGELSGLQSAMNLFYDNPRGFKAEYQNDPDAGDAGKTAAKDLRPADVASRLSGLPRLEVPREATRLTAFIDAGGGVGRGLWYAVAAWDPGFGGSVVDYGCWPRQARSVFAADDMRPGLAEAYPGLSETQRVYAGLTDLTAEVLGRAYRRETTGEELRVERCLVDCGWLSQTVHQFCRATPHAGVVYPSKGVGRTATARGVSEWKPRSGEQSGWHWRLTVSETGRGRMVQFDPDAWKTFLHERLTTALGGKGCLTLFGRSAADHELVAEHCAAESSEPVTIRGATFDKWRVKPHRPDNHLWDCLIGCAVAASVQGLAWSAVSPAAPGADQAPPKRVKLSEVQKRKRLQRGTVG